MVNDFARRWSWDGSSLTSKERLNGGLMHSFNLQFKGAEKGKILAKATYGEFQAFFVSLGEANAVYGPSWSDDFFFFRTICKTNHCFPLYFSCLARLPQAQELLYSFVPELEK